MKIEGSIILITGGASGIGLSISEYFIGLKAYVFICDLQEDKGKDIEKKYSSQCKFIKCDITNETHVESMINTIKDLKGRLDICINSAGISVAELIISSKGVHRNETFKKAFEINTFGSFLVSKHAAKLMVEKATNSNDCNGNIILIASVAGIEAQRGQVAYGGSKAAIIGMTIPMARDLGKYKIRVNTIAPGIIVTPMTESILETGPMKAIVSQTPLKTTGKPIHIALTSEFIIKNDFLNGETIRVDGGVRFPQF